MAKKTKALRNRQKKQRIALQSSRRVAVARTAAIRRHAAAKEAEPLPEGPWYIAQVCGGREMSIGAELKRREIPFWFPMETHEVSRQQTTWDPMRGHAGEFVTRTVWESVSAPLLRGYIFVAMQRDEWHPIVKTVPGLVRLLGASDTTQDLAARMIDEVLREIIRLRSKELIGEFNHAPVVVTFEPGEPVVIAKGQFKGFEATVAAADHEQVRIMVNMLGGIVPLKIRAEYLDKAA